MTRSAIFIAWILIVASFFWMFQAYYTNSDNKWFLGRSDVVTATGPYSFYLDYWIQEGIYPFWNPLITCGMPFAADPVASTVYPPNLVRSLLTFDPTPLKTHIGLALMVGAHVLFGAVGVLALSRRYKLSMAGTLVATFAFIYSAPFLDRLDKHPNHAMIAAWGPWILLALDHALSKPDLRARLRVAGPAGLILGFVFLLGMGQLALYTCVLTAAFGVAYRFSHFPPGKDVLRVASRDTATFAFFYFVAFAIAAPMALPLGELAGHAARGEANVRQLTAGFTYTPEKLFRLLATYAGTGPNPREIAAAGFLPLAFAAAAFLAPRRRSLWLFALVFYVMLDCALGRPFPIATLVETFAPFQIGPSQRAAIVMCLPLAMLAGHGVDALIQKPARRTVFFPRIAFLLVAAALAWWALSPVFEPAYFLTQPYYLLVPIAAALLLSVALPLFPRPTLWAIALPLLVFAEMYIWNYTRQPYLHHERELHPFSLEQLAEAPQPWTQNGRGVVNNPNLNMYSLTPAMNGYDSLHLGSVRHVLSPSAEYSRAMFHSVVSNSSRGHALTKRLFWLSRQYATGPLPPNDQLFPSATTAFLQHDVEALPKISASEVPDTGVDPNFAETKSVDATWLQKRLRAFPKPRAGAPETTAIYYQLPRLHAPPLHSLLRMKIAADVDARASLPIKGDGIDSYLRRLNLTASPEDGVSYERVLPDLQSFRLGLMTTSEVGTANPRFHQLEIVSDTGDEDARIVITRYSPNVVEVQLIDLPAPRILTYLDAWYPGWSATIDGEPTRLMHSAEAFKAVVVPPGTHTVRFAFRSRFFLVGVLISVSTFVLVLLSALVFRGANFRPVS